MVKKRKIFKKVDPRDINREQDSLLHRNRAVIYFNDKEVDAIDEYCSRYNISSRSALFREAIMEKILSVISEDHPRLF